MKVYVVTVTVSRYKDSSIDPVPHAFNNKDTATSFMRKTAKQLFYDMIDEYDGDEYQDTNSDEREGNEGREQLTPTTSGRENDPFWEEEEDEILFGEDLSMGQCYRKAWGMLTLFERDIDES